MVMTLTKLRIYVAFKMYTVWLSRYTTFCNQKQNAEPDIMAFSTANKYKIKIGIQWTVKQTPFFLYNIKIFQIYLFLFTEESLKNELCSFLGGERVAEKGNNSACSITPYTLSICPKGKNDIENINKIKKKKTNEHVTSLFLWLDSGNEKQNLYKVKYHNLAKWLVPVCVRKVEADPNFPVLIMYSLINFHICVDFPYKGTCSHVTNSP